MMPIDKQAVMDALSGRWEGFYSPYTELHGAGRELRGACPLHGGERDSFSVNAETGLWNCHSQCDTGGDVFDFLQAKEGLGFKDALAHLAAFVSLPAAPSAPRKPSATTATVAATPAATYPYVDEDGVPLYAVVRFEPKDFRQRRADGTWGIAGVRRVLYHLPDVLAAVEAGRPVYIVEGEKDADALQALGLIATCNSGGAGKWELPLSVALRGANVVLLPDNDAPGVKHMESVGTSLFGVANRIKRLALPDLPDKGDVSDWLDAGGTKEALIHLAKDAPDWMPPAAPDEPAPKVDAPRATVKPTARPMAERFIDLADISPPPTELPYLFGPYLNVGAAHWLTGKTGIGKSTLLYNLLPALAEGRELWGIGCQPQTILYLDMESGVIGRSMKVQRLYHDAPRVRGRLLFADDIRLPDEMPLLLAFAQERGVGLVVFDTARRCFSVENENDNAEVYNKIIPVLDAFKREGVATLTIGHPAKNGNGSARGAGAQEDAGDVNLTLTMHKGEITDTDGVIALRVTKNRLLGLEVPPLLLQRVGEDHYERLAGENCQQRSPTGDGAAEAISATDRCLADILTHLSGADDFCASWKELSKAMTARGHSQSATERALKQGEAQKEIDRPDSGGYTLHDPFEEEGE